MYVHMYNDILFLHTYIHIYVERLDFYAYEIFEISGNVLLDGKFDKHSYICT